MRGFERGCVIGAVACHGNYLVVALQRLHETFLVHRSRTCDNLYIRHTPLKLVIAHCGDIRAGDYIGITVRGSP